MVVNKFLMLLIYKWFLKLLNIMFEIWTKYKRKSHALRDFFKCYIINYSLTNLPLNVCSLVLITNTYEPLAKFLTDTSLSCSNDCIIK